MEHRWAEIEAFVEFDDRDRAALTALRPIVAPHFDRIVDRFYERILAHEGGRRAISGGAPQIDRLKRSLRAWLESVFAGPWDDAYFHVHSQIGRTHVGIGLEPRYMILAMWLIRWTLQTVAYEALGGDRTRHFPCMQAIAKICDIELTIMLETYRDEYTAQIRRRERLATIGQLGASITHEVKDPLAVIASSIVSLGTYGPVSLDDARVRKHLERIGRSVEQANKVVTALLDVLRTKAPERAECDWNALVTNGVQCVSFPACVRAKAILAPDVGCAHVDAAQVARVIASLVRNAAEAMPEGGVVTVATAGDARAVELTVRDSGPGIPSALLPELFGPLATTKPGGTGLDLALAKVIAEAHGGSISAANVRQGGAELRLTLPRGDGAAASLET